MEHELQHLDVVVVDGHLQTIGGTVRCKWLKQIGYLLRRIDAFLHQVDLTSDSSSEGVSVVGHH